MDAEVLVRPVVETAGLELVEVALRREGGRRVLRVIVDADEPPDLDALAELSAKVSRRLDLEGFDPGPYTLEVSSAGLEHPLRTPGQYRRAVGGRVSVITRGTGERLEGSLVSVTDDALVLSTPDGDRRVASDDVASARTVVDWDAELRRVRR